MNEENNDLNIFLDNIIQESNNNTKNNKINNKKNNKHSQLIHLLIKITIIFIICWISFRYIIGIFVCHNNDNYPSIKDGDLCITYKLQEIAINDVVAYKDSEGNEHIGRVVAKEGDIIDFNESGYTINGNYPYENIYYPTEKRENNIQYPITLKDNEYFILGDMRTEAKDSRIYGPITNLDGKIILQLRRRGF